MKRKLLSIMLCIMLLSSVTIPAFATDYPESDFVCNWQIFNYKDSDELYLTSQVRGYVYSNATNQFVSCDAKLNIYIDKDDIFLEYVEGDGAKKQNNTDKDFSGNVMLTLTKMHIKEVTCVALNPAGSNLSFLTETTNLNGLTMTPRQLVINELNQDGTVEVWTRQETWNGQTDMIVGFILNSTNNQFAKLYMDATGQKWNKSQTQNNSAAVTTSGSDEETYSSDDFNCDWHLREYSNTDQIFLYTQVRGEVYESINNERKVVSHNALLNVFIDKENIFLEFLFDNGEKNINQTNETQTTYTIFFLDNTDLNDAYCKGTRAKGESRVYLNNSMEAPNETLSPRKLIIDELLQGGIAAVLQEFETWGDYQDAILYFDLNSIDNQFSKVYAKAIETNWMKASTPTATPKPTSKPTATPKPTQKPTSTSFTKQNSEDLSVQFVVSFAQNAFFSLYDVDMYLDGEYIANLTQGKIKYIDVDNITKGKHEIVFYKSNGKSVNGSFTATITHNSVIKCKLHAYNNYVDVDDMEMYGLYSNGELLQASMSPLTAMSPNESPYSLNYEISFVENAHFSKYDVDMYVDDQYVTTLVQGYKTDDTYSLPFGGTHTITFYKAGGHSVYGAVQIYVVKESTYFKCRINATSSEIGISNITTNAGEV